METAHALTFYADQIICSNLRPANFKADVKSGYQTIFQSRSKLCALDVAEAEERVFYMPLEGHPLKRIYFRTSSGLFAVGQITPLDLLDERGRTGATLSHVLFFSAADFALLHNNPFLMMDCFEFAQSLEGLNGDYATGEMHPIALNAETLKNDWDSKQKSTSDLTEQSDFLIHFARVSNSLLRAERGQEWLPIALHGEEPEVMDTLRALVDWMPPALRTGSHFDSVFSGASINRIPCAAFGLENKDKPPLQHPVFDVASKTFSSNQKITPITLWERWLMEALLRRENPILSGEIFEWQQWLDGENNEPPTSDLDSFLRVRALDEGAIQNKIQRQLTTQCGSALAKCLLPYVSEWDKTNPEDLMPLLKSGFPNDLLLQWSLRLCQQHSPNSEELAGLSQLAQKTGARPLMHIIWRWQKSWSPLSESLRALPDADYQQFTNWALGTVTFHVCWEVQPHLSGVLTGLLVATSSDADANGLVECLIQASLPDVTVSPPKFEAKTGLLSQLLRRGDPPNKFSAKPSVPQSVSQRWIWLLGALTNRANQEVKHDR